MKTIIYEGQVYEIPDSIDGLELKRLLKPSPNTHLTIRNENNELVPIEDDLRYTPLNGSRIEGAQHLEEG
jgi:hypothetical protein